MNYIEQFINVPEDDDFSKEAEASILANHFSLLIKFTPNTKLYLLSVVAKKGSSEVDILDQPIKSNSGTIKVPLGNSPDVSFKLYCSLYAVEKIAKCKLFLIDDTLRKIVRAVPKTTTKSLKKKELWNVKL